LTLSLDCPHNDSVEPYDLEIGPIQRTFDHLFKSIGQYFQAAQVAPLGSITETSLSTYSQEQLRKTLNAMLKHYGFADLPFSKKIIVDEDSQISGIHRSDNITTYEERMVDGSFRTFNFYSTYGPDNMKASFYWLDMKKDGEQTQGILTKDDRWYLRISTTQDNIFYQRMEREVHHYW
jgi:hypothetical protein